MFELLPGGGCSRLRRIGIRHLSHLEWLARDDAEDDREPVFAFVQSVAGLLPENFQPVARIISRIVPLPQESVQPESSRCCFWV
jgi:hypothetical protein